MNRPDPAMGCVRLFVGLALAVMFTGLLAACGGGSSPSTTAPTPPTPPSPNQLGSATAVQVTCPTSTVNPPVVGSACYTVTISCPGVAPYAADIKVTDPSGSSVGTVIYTVGGGGNLLYENEFIYGNTAVNNVVQAGYTAVQTDFNDTSVGTTGWLDGPGGPLMLSCRWATLAQWVHDNTTIHPSNTAFCATGNSGGAGAIAYSLTRFGGDQIFNYVQPTGGPPFTRIDYGCRCSQQTMQTTDCAGVQSTCYGSDANMFLDPAYGNANCSNGSLPPQTTQWLADSILSSDGKSQLNYKIPVHFIFGSLDMGSGSALAVLWEQAITSTHSNECIADAPHKIADVLDGAQAIAKAMIANCH